MKLRYIGLRIKLFSPLLIRIYKAKQPYIKFSLTYCDIHLYFLFYKNNICSNDDV